MKKFPPNIIYYLKYKQIGLIHYYIKNTKKLITLLPRPHCFLI